MTARLPDGSAVARALQEELQAEIAHLPQQGARPGLNVVLVGDDPASAIHIRNKTRYYADLGMHHEAIRLDASATTEEIVAPVEVLNRAVDVHGVLDQLPIPPQVDSRAVLDRVDLA
jgi:methylenetetrahydrofolate dehydrogenase (NADP+)/methenyltetrahydrofolate cyclohydrolase